MNNDQLKTVEKRRELVFLYSTRECNPNGDPDDENRPRMDDEGFALVSDVRLKRTIRDYLESIGYDILVKRDYDSEDNIKNMDQRITGFLETSELNRSTIIEKIPTMFIDARLFGFVATVKNANCSVTGPVQFAIGKSLNKPNITTHTITSVLSGAKAGGGSIGRFHILDYALFRFQGVICPKLAEKSKMTIADLKVLYKALWKGTQTLNTRSKFNHIPRLLLAFRSRDKEFLCGELAYQLEIEETPDKDPVLIMDKLVDYFNMIGKNDIETVEYKHDERLKLKYNNTEYSRFVDFWSSTDFNKINTEQISFS